MDPVLREYPLLVEIAKNVQPIQSARIVAGIYRRGKLLSIGFNQRKSHPLQAKWASRPERIFLHAEVDAIRNYLYRFTASSLESCDMVVVRVKLKPNGEWTTGCAKPCDGCMGALEFYNLRRVQWSE
jgi:tRNA(Arg) A34 adenosine deaminase TadA